ncbi:hypothetical protein [Actinomadura sp. B10D3]|uniref:hypothetical protein n=1 Tax=Actinomadura sp. B10D3 TaxID=3153557 RepID=UPI00325C9E6D
MGAFDELPRVRRGPLHSLYAALRRRAPQVSATRPDEDGAVLQVAYRGQDAAVAWDGDLRLYAWASEPGGEIGPDAEKAAELIAWTLGASVNPGTSG